MDVGPADAGPMDAGTMDSGIVDARPVDTGGTDTGPADTSVMDAGTSCSGTLTVTITRPTAGMAIETCTLSGMPVYYDFTATTTGTNVRQVVFNWSNPDGGLVPPPFTITAGPPFVARRLVGGVAPPGMTTLANAGGRNAIGGTWQVIAQASDACGRTATAMQPFTLQLTSRGCPNP
jgi:hypothetical protein